MWLRSTGWFPNQFQFSYPATGAVEADPDGTAHIGHNQRYEKTVKWKRVRYITNSFMNIRKKCRWIHMPENSWCKSWCNVELRKEFFESTTSYVLWSIPTCLDLLIVVVWLGRVLKAYFHTIRAFVGDLIGQHSLPEFSFDCFWETVLKWCFLPAGFIFPEECGDSGRWALLAPVKLKDPLNLLEPRCSLRVSIQSRFSFNAQNTYSRCSWSLIIDHVPRDALKRCDVAASSHSGVYAPNRELARKLNNSSSSDRAEKGRST